MTHRATANQGQFTARRRRSARRRPGYVLIVVLGLSLVALSTGIAFIESQGTVLPEAVNRMAAVRARYIAESGVELAIHYLMYPPKSVATGDYFRGVSNQRIDSTNDSFTVVVQKDASIEGQYSIQCKGVALYYDGQIRGAHMIRATVLVPPSDTINIPYAVHTNGDVDLDTGVILIGDLHVEGKIGADGYCNGAVTATEDIDWTGAIPPASITENVPSVPVPSIAPSEYLKYAIDGVEYNALVYPNTLITTANATIIESFLNSMPNNPGRVVYCTAGGKIEIEAGVRINGTLVANENIEFIGAGNHRVVSVDKFPAIVTTGHVHAEDDGTIVELDGTVFCEHIDNHGKNNVTMQINGALVTTDNNSIKNTGGTNSNLIVQWREAKATIYDLANTRERRPATILEWKEN